MIANARPPTVKEEELSGTCFREPQVIQEYELKIVQGPMRARMCGMGDKDRRPISPPLIVKLESFGNASSSDDPTGCSSTRFILAADLRCAQTLEDANLIMSPSSSSGSQTTRTSSKRSPTSASPNSSSLSPYASSTRSSMSPPALACGLVGSEADRKPQISPSPPTQPSPSPPLELSGPANKRRRLSVDQGQTISPSISGHQHVPASNAAARCSDELHTDYFTLEEERIPNLIGTLHANSHVLSDLEGERGTYFVLPDLSVRAEGTYRLRLRLLSINLANALAGKPSPVVAQTHTTDFHVYSAKKFPGMLEPTVLSKHFAAQGVRIPTRQAKASTSKTTSPPQLPAIAESS